MTALRGLLLTAADGPVGRLADIYFHDTLWLVRSLAVHAHHHPARRLLIPVSSVQRCRFDASGIRMSVSLHEAELVGRTAHLGARSACSVLGYGIEAADGSAGRIENVVVDDGGWWIPQFVVHTRSLLPGARHLVASSAVVAIDSIHRKVRLRLARDEIGRLPSPDDATADIDLTLRGA